tara:strand:- start:301 stop:537 length:237 start_codon:yes stop_codon:yes gene_type:complete
METVILLVVVVGILAYYGFMASLEKLAEMGNREVSHLDDLHMVTVTRRTSEMSTDISDETIAKAQEVKAKLAEMRKLQ